MSDKLGNFELIQRDEDCDISMTRDYMNFGSWPALTAEELRDLKYLIGRALRVWEKKNE